MISFIKILRYGYILNYIYNYIYKNLHYLIYIILIYNLY